MGLAASKLHINVAAAFMFAAGNITGAYAQATPTTTPVPQTSSARPNFIQNTSLVTAANSNFRLVAPLHAQRADIVVSPDFPNQPLIASNADTLLHPASVSKLMIFTLLFEQMKKNAVNIDEEFTLTTEDFRNASEHTTHMRPGQKITLRKALEFAAVGSFNDMTVVMGRRLFGSHENAIRPAGHVSRQQ